MEKPGPKKIKPKRFNPMAEHIAGSFLTEIQLEDLEPIDDGKKESNAGTTDSGAKVEIEDD